MTNDARCPNNTLRVSTRLFLLAERPRFTQCRVHFRGIQKKEKTDLERERLRLKEPSRLQFLQPDDKFAPVAFNAGTLRFSITELCLRNGCGEIYIYIRHTFCHTPAGKLDAQIPEKVQPAG